MGSLFHLFYAEVTCRICKRQYCCKDCRRKHEVNVHGIHPDCHVCIYGAIPISLTQTSDELREHLKANHLPLHCVKCGVVFETLESIAAHSFKCATRAPAAKLATAAATPMRLAEAVAVSNAADYQSPDIIGAMGIEMITSTPMMTENQVYIKLPENITPVDADRVDTDTTTYTDKSTKRVTFVTTPAAENIKIKRNIPENLLKSSLKNSLRRTGTNTLFLSQSALETTPSFASAQDNMSTESGSSTKTTRPKSKRLSHSMNDIMWMSAINDSFELDASTDTSEAVYTEKSIQDAGTSYDASTQKTGVWASMTSMFRNVVKSFNVPEMPCGSFKRNRSMTDFELEMEDSILKRQKLCGVKCRPPIRPSSKRIVLKATKSIQTDF